MQRPPRSPKAQILGQGLGMRVFWIGGLMGAISLAVGAWAWRFAPGHWTTMLFTTLTLAQMGNALAVRSDRQSLFQLGLGSNRPMLGAVALTFALQLLITYWAPAQGVFRTTALPPGELLISLAASALLFVALELNKWRLRRRAASGG
jgi:Ca2+-transporting ATPase